MEFHRSAVGSIVESMFETTSSGLVALAEVDDAGLIDVMTDAMRAEAAGAWRRWAAIAELTERRCAAEIAAERELWSCDAWDSVAAEVAAAVQRQPPRSPPVSARLPSMPPPTGDRR